MNTLTRYELELIIETVPELMNEGVANAFDWYSHQAAVAVEQYLNQVDETGIELE